jgi:predicted DsbA family dithiol-disulfide isomerase
MKSLEIQVTSDFICPWCWIGHRHLRTALEEVNPPGATLRYMPYELNPTLPTAGVDRKAYRSAKFGSWARSQAMDAEVVLQGKRAGLHFDYDRVSLTPNTRLAHRLMQFAQEAAPGPKSDALLDSIFCAYFSEGRDIGAADVLAALAAQAGFDAAEVRAYLDTTAGEREVEDAEHEAQRVGIRAVPAIRVGGVPVSGAQPPSVFAQVLRELVEADTSSTEAS